MTYIDLYSHELRYRKFREEAARYRLQRQVLGEKSDLPRPCCALLFWFGCRLVAWGRDLQIKYGESSGHSEYRGLAQGAG